MTGYIPVPPAPWVPTATDGDTKLFPTDTMNALAESIATDAADAESVIGEALAGTFVAGQAVSTDDTNDLPAPTGVGLEFVITAEGLDDIRFDGVSL